MSQGILIVDQNGTRYPNMHILEIYKDRKNSSWYNDETFLCVFDNKNNLVQYYDFCSGLRLVQDEKNMTIYINKNDLVSGKWILFATKNNNNNEKKTIKVEGFYESDKFLNNQVVEYNPENCASGEITLNKERKERLGICMSCPLLNIENMRCTINDRIVLDLTKYENEYCPEEKWGNKEEVLKKNIENGNITDTVKIDQQEQKEFEKELEEYLKGL